MDEGRTENGTEVEWQFDALDLRPVERWLAALPSRPQQSELPTLTALAKPTRRLVDRYVDTEDWRIGRAGYVLRTRRRGRNIEATVKDTRPAAESGLRQRLEVTETLAGRDLADLGDTGPVGRRVAAVAGRRPLVQVLEVRTRRQPFSLRAAGSEVAEVALDETVIVVGGGQRPVQLLRVEVEVVPEWVDALGPLVDDLRATTGLRPAGLSKFEAGLLAAGIEIPGPPDLGPTDAGPGSTFGDLAFAVIRRHLRVLSVKEPGTRLGEDIEELHDMRVATRRLRAAIELFEDVLPARAQVLRAELKWLADALGAVRDLDVQLERMDEMSAWVAAWPGADHSAPLEHLRDLLVAERTAARRDLLDALDSPRWERLNQSLVAMARRGPNRRLPAGREAAALVVPALVDERHRAVVRAARRARRSGVAADYHRLRIRCKRLRYSLEFTAPIYGNGTRKFVSRLTSLQDALGLMQDAEVASTRLYDLATADPDGGRGLPADTVFVMGGVAEHYRRESDELRRSMRRRLGVLDAGAWQDLVGLMQRARGRAAAVVPPGSAGSGVTRSRVGRPAATAVPAGAVEVPGEREEPDRLAVPSVAGQRAATADASKSDDERDGGAAGASAPSPDAGGDGPETLGPETLGPEDLGPENLGPELDGEPVDGGEGVSSPPEGSDPDVGVGSSPSGLASVRADSATGSAASNGAGAPTLGESPRPAH